MYWTLNIKSEKYFASILHENGTVACPTPLADITHTRQNQCAKCTVVIYFWLIYQNNAKQHKQQ